MARTAEEGLLPLELIFKHLLNHRDQIISRRAELAAQGRVANVEIECRLGTLMRGGERVGACESGEEAAIVYGAKFCAGVTAEHHREFKEAARLEYHKQLKLGARLKAERRTLSDVQRAPLKPAFYSGCDPSHCRGTCSRTQEHQRSPCETRNQIQGHLP